MRGLLIFLFLLNSCTTPKITTPTVEPIPTPEEYSIPQIPMPDDEIELRCDNTCTIAEKNESKVIQKKANQIKSGSCFSEYLLNPKNKVDLNQLNGLKLKDAVFIIVKAKGQIGLTYYSKKRNWLTGTIEVGFDNGDGKVHGNRNAYSGMSLCDKVSSVMHEMAHGMKFKHDYYATAERPYSLPYRVQAAVDECCN